MELSISGPETEEDYEAQNRMIREAVEGGAEAIVFSAIDYEKNAAAIAAAPIFSRRSFVIMGLGLSSRTF